MFQLTNDTPFAAERSIQLDAKGVQHWVVVVKCTYSVKTPKPKLAVEQEPVCLKAEYAGEEGQSSLLRDTEMTFAHPGTDVIVNGTAYAPSGRAVPSMDVRVSAGSLSKQLRIVGERRWFRDGPDLIPTRPVPFETMPICYERAFGGALPDGSAFEERNPIGLGFGLKLDDLVDRPLPNVEDATQLIQRALDKPVPAGFGAVAGHWMPRRKRAGTYDDAWKKEKLPLYPDDFQPEFFAAAAVGLHSPEPFKGNERVRVDGMSPDGVVEFSVPREVITVQTSVGQKKRNGSPQLDRVIVDTETKQLVVVWRLSLRLGLRFRDVSGSLVTFKPRVRP